MFIFSLKLAQVDSSFKLFYAVSEFTSCLHYLFSKIFYVIFQVLASRNRLDPPVGFALIIPPGHCPIPKGPTGLCFRKCGHCSSLCPTFTWAKCVFIIDFDAHHGNGTNDAFYDDPDIFIISTHQVRINLVQACVICFPLQFNHKLLLLLNIQGLNIIDFDPLNGCTS